VFFDELDPHAFTRQGLHNAAQVIEIAGEPIHAIDDHGIAASHKAHQLFQLWPLGIFAGCFFGEGFVDLDAFELPFGTLTGQNSAGI
jgi:hypothetical protein